MGGTVPVEANGTERLASANRTAAPKVNFTDSTSSVSSSLNTQAAEIPLQVDPRTREVAVEQNTTSTSATKLIEDSLGKEPLTQENGFRIASAADPAMMRAPMSSSTRQPLPPNPSNPGAAAAAAAAAATGSPVVPATVGKGQGDWSALPQPLQMQATGPIRPAQEFPPEVTRPLLIVASNGADTEGRGFSATFTDRVQYLGLQVAWDKEWPEIFRVVPEGESHKQGITPGDVLVEINGMVTRGHSKEECLTLLRQRPLTIKMSKAPAAVVT